MKELDAALERLVSGECSLHAWVSALDDDTARAVARTLRERIDALPIPLRPRRPRGIHEGDPRLDLERILAGVEARGASAEHFLALERECWRGGGRCLPYLLALERSGHPGDLAALARAQLHVVEEEDDRATLEALIDRGATRPPGWDAEVCAIAEAPTMERWEALFQFTPPQRLYERMKLALQRLEELGVDGNTLFRFSTRWGCMSDSVGLVKEGKVDTAVVEARAHESTPGGRPLWLSLAARAACLHGDRLGTVRLLEKACSNAPPDLFTLDLAFVWEHADDELKEMLDRAGIPRYE